MKKIAIFLLSFLAVTASVAQETTKFDAKETDNNLIKAALKGWHLKLRAGFNIGGTSPLPLPKEIRSIEKYQPTMSLAIEGLVHKKFYGSKWGMATGVRLEKKGMKTDARVKNYHMEAVNADGTGKINGAWTGGVRTEVDNSYLTFPLLATCSISRRWEITAGPYFSWMFNGKFTGNAHDGYIRDGNPTGEKAEVSYATYDFSDNLRKFHWGMQVGGEFKAYKHLSVYADLQWGLNGIFPEKFESVTFSLYPIYATVGFGYLF